jgi:DNA-binding IscR family transcriptional regulator
MAEIYRSVEDSESFAIPTRKPSVACPVGHCILEALARVFASAQNAMEKDLEKTTLADVIDAVKASGKRVGKKAV